MRANWIQKFLLRIKGGFIVPRFFSFKIGRDIRTGQFIPVKTAERRKATAVVETITRSR